MQIEKRVDIGASHPAELLSGVHAHDRGKGRAGSLGHRAEELKVLKQGGLCGISARKARRKMNVSLAWQKAGFNRAQGAVCLRGAPIPMAVQGLVRSQCSACLGTSEMGLVTNRAAGHNRWGSNSPSCDQFTCLRLALDCSGNDLLEP